MLQRSIVPRLQPRPTQWLLRFRGPQRARSQKRHNSTNDPRNSDSPSSQRADSIIARLPRSFQKYASRLRSAPVSHIAAFAILHEITAVIPLVGLFGLFHYTNYVPLDYMVGRYGGYAVEATGRFERYFTRKGWFGFGQEVNEDHVKAEMEGAGGPSLDGNQLEGGSNRTLQDYQMQLTLLEQQNKDRLMMDRQARDGSSVGRDGEGMQEEEKSPHDVMLEKWRSADRKYKIVVEVALAYAITKALLPARIVVSLWATPWFAGVLGRVQRVFRRSR